MASEPNAVAKCPTLPHQLCPTGCPDFRDAARSWCGANYPPTAVGWMCDTAGVLAAVFPRGRTPDDRTGDQPIRGTGDNSHPKRKSFLVGSLRLRPLPNTKCPLPAAEVHTYEEREVKAIPRQTFKFSLRASTLKFSTDATPAELRFIPRRPSSIYTCKRLPQRLVHTTSRLGDPSQRRTRQLQRTRLISAAFGRS